MAAVNRLVWDPYLRLIEMTLFLASSLIRSGLRILCFNSPEAWIVESDPVFLHSKAFDSIDFDMGSDVAMFNSLLQRTSGSSR